ncbi:gliding motility-associated-like protein [Chitinophaga dinghuensis]|uniref:Gliding motility-associated-like protein n=1 Tax=Chitinophaga dinghuensis TaxID=1539050 RepID=A0A327VS65_9BACT|nr:gliding motility-associated C-terminal domain-containing protein [Chitinophaga dinghuensis]RAJ77284.1 gliding motility-associated-like protein [Chitinophaga dinghuensis]
MSKKLSLAVILLCVSVFSAYGQKQWNTWYFGNGVGIDFNGSQPVALNNSSMNQMEGSASISDDAGQLLFYTDGVTVYNRFHQVMMNGTGLMGHSSSTQSALIVPKPGDKNIYYIFTIPYRGDPAAIGLRYSEVDMRMDNGKGGITINKNTPLVTDCYEKVAAVKHCNNRDVWVTTYQLRTNSILSFLVTPNGVTTQSVYSGPGQVGGMAGYLPVERTVGYIRYSPNGKKIALAYFDTSFQIADFDNMTGKISNSVFLYYYEIPGGTYLTPYGLEFSPDSKTLYLGSAVPAYGGELFSMDVSMQNATAMRSSVIQILPWDEYREVFSLCLGPDNKIYIAEKTTNNYTSVLTNPNNRSNPGYVNGVIRYNSGNATLGLPNIIAGNAKTATQLGDIVIKQSCTDQSITYGCTDLSGVDSVHWHFGEGDTTRIPAGAYTYTKEDKYLVSLIRFYPCYSDTLTKSIDIKVLKLSLGNDIALCEGQPLLLKGDQPDVSYLWNDGSTGQTLSVSSSGQYWLEIQDAKGCKVRSTIQVLFKPYPVLKALPDIFLCDKKPVQLDITSDHPGAKYYLQGVEQGPILDIKKAGTYKISVALDECETTGSFQVEEDTLPHFSLGGKMELCTGSSILLDLSSHHFPEYTWQDGSHASTYKIVRPGRYYMTARNKCGMVSDTLKVVEKDCEGYFMLPTAFTPNHDGKNDLFRPVFKGTINGYLLQVYSRWGNRVFVSNDPRIGWDGKLGNLPLPAGSYIWQLNYRTYQTDELITKTGSVLLIR